MTLAATAVGEKAITKRGHCFPKAEGIAPHPRRADAGGNNGKVVADSGGVEMSGLLGL